MKFTRTYTRTSNICYGRSVLFRCLPPFCISQETLPRVPGGFALTTTKSYGSTGHIIYDIWREVGVWKKSGTNWGDNTGIWNVLCTASNSNFWTQRAFCSSANKSLWAAFSDTAENRSPLVREVRIKVFLKAATVRAVRAPQIDLQNFNIFKLRFGHVFLALLVVIVNKWISTSLIIASRSIQSST